MIQSVLEKCLGNLNLDKPDLSYVKGMLEVLLAMQEKPKTAPVVKSPVPAGEANGVDEAAILDARAKAAIEQVKLMTGTEG